MLRSAWRRAGPCGGSGLPGFNDDPEWTLSMPGRLVPDNVSLLRLPVYSPGLNPTEKVWACLPGSYHNISVGDTSTTARSWAKINL